MAGGRGARPVALAGRTPTARPSPSSSTPPPPASPSSPSPPTPTNAKPTSAKSTLRPEPARRLLRPPQPPGHRRPRNPDSRPPARRRARLPHGHRARRRVHAARAHHSMLVLLSTRPTGRSSSSRTPSQSKTDRREQERLPCVTFQRTRDSRGTAKSMSPTPCQRVRCECPARDGSSEIRSTAARQRKWPGETYRLHESKAQAAMSSLHMVRPRQATGRSGLRSMGSPRSVRSVPPAIDQIDPRQLHTA